MRSSIIRFAPKQKRFYCGHETVSWQQLGRMIAWALLQRKQTILLPFQERCVSTTRSWSHEVSIGYVQQMLAFAGEHGWFWDEVPEFVGGKDATCDHHFDPNNITPGRCWGLVSQLRQTATALKRDAEWEKHFYHRDKAVQERAAATLQEAQRLLQEADRVLTAGIPLP